MGGVAQFYMDHAFWAWAAVAATLLAIEVSTGSGYLLWPAAAAGVVAVIVAIGLSPGLPWEIGIFAALTIASTLLAHRFIRTPTPDGVDINDVNERLVGRQGVAVGAFKGGRGRVFVEGKEWAAEADEAEALADGDRITVAGVADGASLRVARA